MYAIRAAHRTLQRDANARRGFYIFIFNVRVYVR